MTTRLGVSSHVATAFCTDAVVSDRYRFRSASILFGSPRKVLYWLSTSALPPNPPMRSSPETNSASCLVLERSSSAADGPSLASRAISAATTFSISASDEPGRAVAWTTNTLAISAVMLNDDTCVASGLS